MLVFLWVIEAANEGPDEFGWGLDAVDDQRGACVGEGVEFVVVLDEGFEFGEFCGGEAVVGGGVGVHGWGFVEGGFLLES